MPPSVLAFCWSPLFCRRLCSCWPDRCWPTASIGGASTATTGTRRSSRQFGGTCWDFRPDRRLRSEVHDHPQRSHFHSRSFRAAESAGRPAPIWAAPAAAAALNPCRLFYDARRRLRERMPLRLLQPRRRRGALLAFEPAAGRTASGRARLSAEPGHFQQHRHRHRHPEERHQDLRPDLSGIIAERFVRLRGRHGASNYVYSPGAAMRSRW